MRERDVLREQVADLLILGGVVRPQDFQVRTALSKVEHPAGGVDVEGQIADVRGDVRVEIEAGEPCAIPIATARSKPAVDRIRRAAASQGSGQGRDAEAFERERAEILSAGPITRERIGPSDIERDVRAAVLGDREGRTLEGRLIDGRRVRHRRRHEQRRRGAGRTNKLLHSPTSSRPSADPS